MNSEAQELVKLYITETLKDTNGISSTAYNLIEHMLKTDRTLATLLHDAYSQTNRIGNRYYLPIDEYREE